MSLFEDQSSTAAQDPITAIYTAIRDNAVLTGKQTYQWSELTTLLGRFHTVSHAKTFQLIFLMQH